MISTAPLTNPWNILSALVPQPAAEAAAGWRRPGDQSLVLARSCWSLALLAGMLGSKPKVALPAWFCNASLLPLRAMGAELIFVPVNENGWPDWSNLGQADMVVTVHTFGHPVPLDSARAACDRTGAILVEDAAHALAPAPGIGESGDYVLYSPHKVLALPDGAVIVARNRPLPAGAGQSSGGVFRWLSRRLIQWALPDPLRSWIAQGGQINFLDDPTTTAMPPLCTPSPVSLRLMTAADLTVEATMRRMNAASLRQTLGHLPGWHPLFTDDGPAPYRFALRCDHTDIAIARYAALRHAHLPVESWPDLPPEVSDATAIGLRRSVILLPVHGALPPGYEQLYAKALAHA
ncbi:DegT/DnrJ/EryC1/StrS family aminotransferase [Magnetospirillum sulfuroxidans]|uniref:DegT/DnrJ/EryC1/StrS family aminotransferase n=1 Tax=Magnetospirillum sulfuroxidans TaxID=611300 RepID=A0ABS5IH01_9PROT|nr:DegT/DnrJ/EryC1/StrS family aminotransferase [Magnetospirillum sulfuroxidans]MBR9973702.1 DegT/DnrJ/EryC1/StrS family aminotransferase [Magnetospirillum sulfuroxidans]